MRTARTLPRDVVKSIVARSFEASIVSVPRSTRFSALAAETTPAATKASPANTSLRNMKTTPCYPDNSAFQHGLYFMRGENKRPSCDLDIKAFAGLWGKSVTPSWRLDEP
ncbi:MAG: hypothetical protein ACRETL_02855 [Gammaproteobacteria bacterium]